MYKVGTEGPFFLPIVIEGLNLLDITELYDDESFNNLLIIMAGRKRIIEFDDFRQDVFLEIVDRNARTMTKCRQAANRVAQRYGDMDIVIDIMAFSLEDDNGDLETYDETMGRLVYHGRGRYI